MGPFPCGDWPDINCFRFVVKWLLEDGEQVEADDSYLGEDPLNANVPGSMVHSQDDAVLLNRALVRRRHESVNKRFKQFKCASTTFRHDISFHGPCFRAVVVLTQLAILRGKPLWTVAGYVDP